MFQILASIFTFCFTLGVQAQTLSGDYQGYLYKNYYIGKYEKGKFVLIDSLQLDEKGTFIKQLDSKIYTTNMLYVVASEAEYKEKKNIANPHPHGSIQFVFMGKDVSYKTSWRQETGYLNFIKGGEPSNHIKDLYIHLDKTQTLLNQMEQLMELLEVGDPFNHQLMKSYIERATDFNLYCQKIAANYQKGSFMNKFTLMFQQVIPEKGMSFKDFQVYRAQNLFMFTDLNNQLVANVPILTAMYRSYLYYNQPSGMAMSDVIQKMQDDAKNTFYNKACPEVIEALNLQDFKPQALILREKLTKDLNFDTLYSDSKQWFAEINDIIGAYEKRAPYHHIFAKDIITALERTNNPEAYTKLAEDAFSITEQFNWAEAQNKIVEYLTIKTDNRLLNTSGKVAQIYAAKNVQIGKLAPDLTFVEFIDKGQNKIQKSIMLMSKDFSKGGFNKTLLVFHQSGCGPCKELMEQLPENYNFLKSKGVRIISIGADENQEKFNTIANNLPWPDKYFDYEGLKGVNFKNYAILGTPTLFLINEFGKIEAKLASVNEVLELLK